MFQEPFQVPSEDPIELPSVPDKLSYSAQAHLGVLSLLLFFFPEARNKFAFPQTVPRKKFFRVTATVPVKVNPPHLQNFFGPFLDLLF